MSASSDLVALTVPLDEEVSPTNGKTMGTLRKQLSLFNKDQLCELTSAIMWSCAGAYEIGEELFDSDPVMRRLLVRGLLFSTTDETFQNYFLSFGELVNAAIIRHPDRRSQGYGFLIYKKRDAAEKVLSQKHVIDGRSITIKLAAEKPEEAASKSLCQKCSEGEDIVDRRKLFIRNIRPDITREVLLDRFSVYGPVEECAVIPPTPGGSASYGFVTFRHKSDAVKAAQLPYRVINNWIVFVAFSTGKGRANASTKGVASRPHHLTRAEPSRCVPSPPPVELRKSSTTPSPPKCRGTSQPERTNYEKSQSIGSSRPLRHVNSSNHSDNLIRPSKMMQQAVQQQTILPPSHKRPEVRALPSTPEPYNAVNEGDDEQDVGRLTSYQPESPQLSSASLTSSSSLSSQQSFEPHGASPVSSLRDSAPLFSSFLESDFTDDLSPLDLHTVKKLLSSLSLPPYLEQQVSSLSLSSNSQPAYPDWRLPAKNSLISDARPLYHSEETSRECWNRIGFTTFPEDASGKAPTPTPPFSGCASQGSISTIASLGSFPSFGVDKLTTHTKPTASFNSRSSDEFELPSLDFLDLDTC